VLEQQTEVEKAIIGIGQYTIRNEYQQFQVESSKWFAKFNEDQKKNALKKFHTASVDDKKDEMSRYSGSLLSVPTDSSNSATKPTNDLSVDVLTASKLTSLSTLILRQTWAKSKELLGDCKVTQASSNDIKASMVASRSSKRPHFVATNEKNPDLFECDENCPAFNRQHLCAHCIAAAEHNNLLKQYLDAYSKYVQTPAGRKRVIPNYPRLSMNNLPRGIAGRKGDKPPKSKATK
jgi:hypothetical protein